MKTMEDPGSVREIRERIAALRPDDQRRWGTMSVEEMMAHVREAYVLSVSGQAAERKKGPLPPAVMKFLALKMPVAWPQGVPTVAALEREAMPPAGSFADELGRLREAVGVFVAAPDNTTPHAYFGAMRPWDWMRWGYLHADHHLRQFGR